MTVVAKNLVDNKTKVISTVTGSVNEESQSALDVTKLIDSTSEPRVSVVNVHHEILGTGKVTLLFDEREVLELTGRGNYGLKKDEKKIETETTDKEGDLFVKSDANVSKFNLVLECRKESGFN
jgi:hypothetical protein|tara:strand:+ start:320 stop:688 length:369 start_codon:yes stop_codon:yes gene_type:complete